MLTFFSDSPTRIDITHSFFFKKLRRTALFVFFINYETDYYFKILSF